MRSKLPSSESFKNEKSFKFSFFVFLTTPGRKNVHNSDSYFTMAFLLYRAMLLEFFSQVKVLYVLVDWFIRIIVMRIKCVY